MDNYVITIARGFGSGGKHIGQELSLRLGIPCYESQILSMASTYSGLSEGLFNKVDERLKNLNILQRLLRTPSLDFIVQPADKKFTGDLNLFNIQTKIIKELCKKQSCIIIGKCANWLLKDEENVASFYVEAPRKNCLESITNLLGVDEKEWNDHVEHMAFMAYEDQCSPANPRVPLVEDMVKILKAAYHGYQA